VGLVGAGPGPVAGVEFGEAAAEANRIPISGDHIPGILPGMLGVETVGGATGARTGWGAVRGGAVSAGRTACTWRGGCDGGWVGGAAV
jgi:hypothetical protein